MQCRAPAGTEGGGRNPPATNTATVATAPFDQGITKHAVQPLRQLCAHPITSGVLFLSATSQLSESLSSLKSSPSTAPKQYSSPKKLTQAVQPSSTAHPVAQAAHPGSVPKQYSAPKQYTRAMHPLNPSQFARLLVIQSLKLKLKVKPDSVACRSTCNGAA
jgi:hypothetical protein